MRLIWESPVGRRVYSGEWSELLDRCKWALRVNRLNDALDDVASLVL